MKIIVDADACPVTEIAVSLAKEKQLSCILVSDFNHILKDSYAKIITVDHASNSADMKIIEILEKQDIVVTQDYGLAALVLSKKAFAIHPSGMIYNADNMDKLLFERFLSAEMRRKGEKTKKIKKRTKSDNVYFKSVLKRMIEENESHDESE